ncbi:hypothetical protein ACUHMQ_18780, partial [Chitinimonas sp. PSY-7]
FGDVLGNSIAGNGRKWVEPAKPVVPEPNRSERPRDWRDLFDDEVVPATPMGNSGPTGDEGGYIDLARRGEPYGGDSDGRVQGRGVAFRGNMYGKGTASAANNEPVNNIQMFTGKARLPAETVDEFNARVFEARLNGTLGQKGPSGPIYDKNIHVETWKTIGNGAIISVANFIPDAVNGGAAWLEQFAHTKPGALGRMADWVDVRNPVAQSASVDLRGVAGGLLSLAPIKYGKYSAGVSNGVEWIPATDIRFSQNSVSFNKIDRATGKSYNYDDLVTSMRQDGWKGDPVDVVRMQDSKLTSMDNTRIRAAREAQIDVQANVRSFTDPLTQSEIGRFTKKAEVPTTWGEALLIRINSQSGKFGIYHPNGADTLPRVKGQ